MNIDTGKTITQDEYETLAKKDQARHILLTRMSRAKRRTLSLQRKDRLVIRAQQQRLKTKNVRRATNGLPPLTDYKEV